MAYQLERLKGPDGLPVAMGDELEDRIERLIRADGPRLRRLWAYYRNPMQVTGHEGTTAESGRPYRQAQEWGLPPRITGIRSGREMFTGQSADGLNRKEVVIENDIGWRVEAMVDYLFGKSVVIRSAAPEESRRPIIDRLIESILEHNGGVQFFQRLALLGAVYGFVDVLVKLDDGGNRAEAYALRPESDSPPAEPGQGGPAPAPDDLQTGTGAGNCPPEALIQRIARMVRLEIVEPARALPMLCPADYRIVQAYVQCYALPRRRPQCRRSSEPPRRWWERWLQSAEKHFTDPAGQEMAQVVEIITPTRWQRYEDLVLMAEGVNSLGQVPLVHIQNTSVPFEYAGMSEVESLIPLQDELNTRLSDRASRITLQSFRMYLGKNIEGFDKMPVAPGRMWTAQDPEADVIEFGGDSACPSESLHIADLREAMDKTSGVSPIAAGAIKNRIGRLTSAAALRLTLISLLAKTDKKRTTYGQGIERMIDLSLTWLDRAGVFSTTPEERLVELHWPSPLPENDVEKLQEAEIKTRLGVPKEVVLRELGY